MTSVRKSRGPESKPCRRAARGIALRLLRVMLLVPLFTAVSACAASGDGPGGAAPAGESHAVSGFQQHLDRLKVPLELPASGKAILVNVPAFELIAFADGEPVLRSRVIIGAPWHPTPMLETYTTAVRFRPTWRPTPAMVRSGEYEDRLWPPGRRNPLGLAAIRLQPGLLVYLHDTNRRDLFGRDQRALSHGCIRVQRWDELVAWLLDLGLDEVNRLANGRRTFDMPTAPVPVRVGYFLLFPDDAGQPVRYADVYGRTAATGQRPAGTSDPAGQASAAPGCAATPSAG